MEANKELQGIMTYVNNLAYGLTENKECQLLTGKRINEVDAKELKEFSRIINYLVLNISKRVEEMYVNGKNAISKSDASPMFQYVFDKTIESFYLTITGGDTSKLVFDIGDVINNEYYEISVPDNLQQKINKVVPRIVLLARNTYQFMQDNDYMGQPISKWLYIYLNFAESLAMQFVIEMDLSSGDAFDFVLNEISKRALKTIGLDANDTNYVDIMGHILVGLCSNEEDDLIAAKTFNVAMTNGIFLPEEEIKNMCTSAREKCEKQLRGLQMAYNSIQDFSCTGVEALSQIQNLL